MSSTYERVIRLLSEFKGRSGIAPTIVFMDADTAMAERAQANYYIPISGLKEQTYCGCKWVVVSQSEELIAVGYEAAK